MPRAVSTKRGKSMGIKGAMRFAFHTPRKQQHDVQSVIDYVKGQKEYTGTLASSLFSLHGMGVCAAYAAYYLIDKLVNHGDFWNFLPSAQHRLAVVSEYLDDDYRRIGGDAVVQRCLALMRRKGVKVAYEGYPPPDFTADQVFDYLFKQNN